MSDFATVIRHFPMRKLAIRRLSMRTPEFMNLRESFEAFIVSGGDTAFVDDAPRKAVGIHTGRRPIAAFDNADGDFQMLEWTTSRTGCNFGLIVHRDDADRADVYDRVSRFGRLDKRLSGGPERGPSATRRSSA